MATAIDRAMEEIARPRRGIGHEAIGDLRCALARGAGLAMAEGPALLGGNHGRNVDRGIRAQRHHVHVGPEAAALGQHAIAEQAAQIDHVGQIVVAGRIDVIGIRLRHAHGIRHAAHSATA